MPTTPSQQRASRKYDSAHTKQYHIKLNLKTDADIISHLDRQPSMQGYIKSLIRADIRKETNANDYKRNEAEILVLDRRLHDDEILHLGRET